MVVPNNSMVANAIGAAMCQVSGLVDIIVDLKEETRDEGVEVFFKISFFDLIFWAHQGSFIFSFCLESKTTCERKNRTKWGKPCHH